MKLALLLGLWLCWEYHGHFYKSYFRCGYEVERYEHGHLILAAPPLKECFEK